MDIKTKYLLRRIKDISKDLRPNRYQVSIVSKHAKELEYIAHELENILKNKEEKENEVLRQEQE